MINRKSFFFFLSEKVLNELYLKFSAGIAWRVVSGVIPVWNASPPNEENNRGTLSLQQEATQIKCGKSRGPLSEIYSIPKGANMWIKNIYLSWKTIIIFFRMRQWNVNIISSAVQYHFYAPLISMFCPHLWQGHIFISFHIMPANNGPQPLLSLLLFPMQFRCCGVTNHTDWFEVYNATRVPDSCCLEYSDNCGQDNPGTWWTAVSFCNIFISLVGFFLLSRSIRAVAFQACKLSALLWCWLKSWVSTIYWILVNYSIERYEENECIFILFYLALI